MLSTARPDRDSSELRFPGVASLEVNAGDRRTDLPVLAEPLPPGPVAGRPGGGAPGSLDLSNVYSTEGLLADSDGDEIPDRIDVLLVPEAGSAAVVDLAARLGLETTGITLPLVKTPDEIEDAALEPATVLLGTAAGHPLVAELADSGKLDLSGLLPARAH